jgi:hypothetical protein
MRRCRSNGRRTPTRMLGSRRASQRRIDGSPTDTPVPRAHPRNEARTPPAITPLFRILSI